MDQLTNPWGSLRANSQAPLIQDNFGPSLLHGWFELQARMRPDHTAVAFDQEHLSYRQLERLANRMARCLRSHGVGRGSRVVLWGPKSCGMFAAILAILKSGAAYVPIDPSCPPDRLASIIEDATVKVAISTSDADAFPLPHSVSVLSFGRGNRAVSGYSARSLHCDVQPSDSCYIIYTSGSTGRPKGVIVEHRNAVNFVRALASIYRLSADDRVYQGFSIAFDASIEEIWAALAFGGSLVVPPEHIAKSALDVGDFITQNKITFFSTVPTFLAMIEGDLPTVRLLVVGGEQCAPELVARWADSRRMMNTYGPTETTVVVTAGDCIPGRAVTIGTALPGCTTYVLDEQLQPVAPGEVGELFIGGECVARGYLNRPDLTDERFVTGCVNQSPDGQRLFRTHDLVSTGDDGALKYVGRNDQMIKIRGYRVELSEIEAVLLEDPGVRAAAVKSVQHGTSIELAAYVVIGGGLTPDRTVLAERLERRLPDYMIPRHLDVVEELPTLVSGKVDRNLLPPPQVLLKNEKGQQTPPATPLETLIVQAFETSLNVSPVFANDDFFRDLKGHSYLAAKMISELRKSLKTTKISVRDIYSHRTAIQLAQHLQSIGLEASPAETAATQPKTNPHEATERPVGLVGRFACAVAQVLTLLTIHGLIVAPILYLTLLGIDVLNGRIEWWRAVENASTFALFIWPCWFAISIIVKWLIIGRYRIGRYRVWGLYYLRFWIVSRFQSLSWCGMFVGTPLMSLYFRAMGARVGPGCVISTSFCHAFDLVSIGSGTCIGADTHILGCRVEDGYLILDQIEIGENCFVGVHCNVGLAVRMGNRAGLDDMSMLPDATIVRDGEMLRGSPAAPATIEFIPIVGRRPKRSVLFGFIHLLLIYVMGYLLMLSIVPGVLLASHFYLTDGPAAAVASAFVAVPLSALCWLCLVLLVKRCAIGQIRPGVYSVFSAAFLRIWFLRYLLDNTRHLLVPVYATMLMPKFLRLLGAKIGRSVEISTVMHVMPDLIQLGEGSFLADGCIVGGLRIYRGCVELLPTKVGARTFVGNSALVPPGVDIGRNGLIGVMSTPPANKSRCPDGTRWLGSPSFELPAASKTHDLVSDESKTYLPSRGLVAQRAFMEALRMLLPAFILAAHVSLWIYLVDVCRELLPFPAVYFLAPAFTLSMSFTMVWAASCVKRALIGTFVPTVQPLWSGYVWRNEIVNSVYESIAANALSMLLGTPLAGPCLRMMGCKIGKWVYLQTTLFSEFDLVKIGDGAALNLGSTVQTHLFEDRVMKVDGLEIGDRCSVGNMSVVLYGVHMQDGASLGPMSLVMKGETLPAGSRWHGIPTQRIQAQDEVLPPALADVA